MKYPYERFLRFLVSRKLNVSGALERYGLPRAGDLWLAECRGYLRRSAPYALVQYLNGSNDNLDLRDGILDWAAEQKILPLWMMQPEFGSQVSPELELAFQVFANPHARATIGMLLLSRATEAELIEVMQEQFSLTMTAASLALYRDVFWDVNLMGRETWQAFIQTIENVEERSLISFGVTGPAMIEVRDQLGMDVTGVNHRSILNNIIAKSYQQYRTAMEQPNPEQHDAMKWAELTLKAITTAKAAGGFGPDPDELPKTTADRLKRLFAVQPVQMKHPTLSELSGVVGKQEVKKEKEVKAK